IVPENATRIGRHTRRRPRFCRKTPTEVSRTLITHGEGDTLTCYLDHCYLYRATANANWPRANIRARMRSYWISKMLSTSPGYPLPDKWCKIICLRESEESK